MAFRLLGERIAVIADEVDDKTDFGLIIPEGSSGEALLRYGTVAVVSIGRRSEAGNLVPIDIEKGDRVFFHKLSGVPMKLDGTEYVFLSPSEIVGIDDGKTGTLHAIKKEQEDG